MAIFHPVSISICILSLVDVDTVALLNVLDHGDKPPSLSGMLLADAVLEANVMHLSLQDSCVKACEGYDDFQMMNNKYLTYKGRLAVPAYDNLCTYIIQELYYHVMSTHLGVCKICLIVAKLYWWLGLHRDIDTFVANYPCFSAKHPCNKTPGLLHPLSVPERAQQHIMIDFKEMPKSKRGYDNTLNMINCFSKLSQLSAYFKTTTIKDVAWMYYQGPFCVYRLPQSMVSDRGPQFITNFTDKVSCILGIKQKLTSSGYSQTSG